MSKAFKLHAYHKTLWALKFKSRYYHLRRVRVEIRACVMDPMQVFPRRASLLAPKGGRPYGTAGAAGSDRDCGPRGGIGEELLGAALFGTAGRRPNRD